jgi:hypothetical protein
MQRKLSYVARENEHSIIHEHSQHLRRQDPRPFAWTAPSYPLFCTTAQAEGRAYVARPFRRHPHVACEGVLGVAV